MHTDDSRHHPNEPTESPSDDSLERYFAGRCTPAERATVEGWLGAQPERAIVARSIAHEFSAPAPRFDAEAMLVRARLRIDEADRRRASPLRRVGEMLAHRGIALSAAAVLLLATGLVMYERVSRRDHESFAISAPAREVVAKPGQQAIMDLPDGSRVILAAGSTLRIPGDFNVRGPAGVRRELYLEGKAHFRVDHDERRPFIVRTSTAITEDVGTEFVVRAYPENRATEVVVISGAVALHRPSANVAAELRRDAGKDTVAPRPLVVLAPGDVAELDSGGTVTLARNVNTARYVSWTTGVLALDGTPLGDALAELSRWYDVEFRVNARELDSLRISGEFRNESVDVAMQRLGRMLGVHAERAGRTVVLSPTR